jgi:hypothetical protein
MRSYTLETSLQTIEPHLATLIAPDAMERLRAVSRCFPDAITFSYGFEYRLHPPAPTVDFAIHISEAERDILAGLAPHMRLAAPFAKHPVWQRIRQFGADWSDPSAELHHHVADLWLEFDVQGDSPAATTDLPVPAAGSTHPHGPAVAVWTWNARAMTYRR